MYYGKKDDLYPDPPVPVRKKPKYTTQEFHEFYKRFCPECGVIYNILHPVSDCQHGIIERVMET